ncbi:hypothetical protein [Vibrio diabolicus]|uniref:hypothetical protein n=1 Tax=Vibrio diabolicus TaxID=50719 RepID=UPI00215EC31C|nr:hypothetical protein [Vibrio diabolicus]MCS0362771.1 hypothetical protein [Vibrio diabolicus]MCS0427356.1 hypothetical protein [Vibrio diabolicus]
MKSIDTVQQLTSEHILDPDTGAVSPRYYWKRNKVPTVEIKGKLPNKLSGLTLIKKDLVNALNWIRTAKSLTNSSYQGCGGYFEPDDREVYNQIKALFVASLTFYGKCFTEANGRGAQASKSWLNEEYTELHEYYMNFRHNFAAHSGDEKVELARTFVLLHPKKKSEILPYLTTVRQQPDLVLPTEGDKGLEELIEYVITLVDEKYEKLSFKIIDDLILSEGVAYWRQKSKKGAPVVLGYPQKKRN